MAVVTSGLNYLKGSEPFVGRDLYVVAQALFADQGKEIIDILVELGAMKRSYDKEAEQSSMSPTNQAEKPKRQERKDHGNEKGAGTAHSKSSLPLLGVKVGRHDQGRLPSCSRPSESGGERLVLRSRRPKNPLLQVGRICSPPHTHSDAFSDQRWLLIATQGIDHGAVTTFSGILFAIPREVQQRGACPPNLSFQGPCSCAV